MTKLAEIRCGHECPDWPGPVGPHSMLPPWKVLHITNAPLSLDQECQAEPRAGPVDDNDAADSSRGGSGQPFDCGRLHSTAERQPTTCTCFNAHLTTCSCFVLSPASEA